MTETYTDSVAVLGMLKIVYTIYTISVMSLIAWFARNITRPTGRPSSVKPSIFYSYVGVLITVGVSIHILTFNQIPWVEDDFKRDHIKAAQIVNITVKDHKFILPSEKIILPCHEYVLFNVESKDLTYGFGLVRQNYSLVTQMQVVPGSKNDLMWKFHKNGVYTITSTEYSGPLGAHMNVENAVEVRGCEQDDPYSMLAMKD
jgi:cytochrome c oxidase subunit 2